MRVENTVVVMVTVTERVHQLNAFLASLERYEPGRAIFIHLQGPENERERWHELLQRPEDLNLVGILESHERMGCHAARIQALRCLQPLGFSHYVNVDDDVLLTEHTRWQPAIDFTDEPGVGFVLTGWVPHPNKLAKAVEIMSDEFVPQIMVYNGGGMAYSNEVADLIRQLDPAPARYDDLWPLTAYIHGYRNYRFRGSLSVHHILQRGGMQAYMAAEPRPLAAENFVRYRWISGARVGQDYAIPQDSDVLQETQLLHDLARAERGWPSHRSRA